MYAAVCQKIKAKNRQALDQVHGWMIKLHSMIEAKRASTSVVHQVALKRWLFIS